MIKYLGSKRLLVPAIVELISGLPGARRVADLFSGTSRVGHALKAAGFQVLANDHNAYAATLARCYVAADREDVAGPAEGLLRELATLPPRPGWFTRTYCEESRFFRPENGARIEAVRQAIAERELDPEVEAVALTALMEAADRVDSTTGVQMAYLKQWAARAQNPLALRMPTVLSRARHGKGAAFELDAAAAARAMGPVDVAYLDPPYNQHKYLGNYHVWETLVRWDQPEVYGRARKRVDCRERKSPFNSRRGIRDAFRGLLDAIDARHLVVSMNDEGFLTREEVEDLLAARGGGAGVAVHAFDYRRYVGARIGIHNPAGQRVGTVGRLRNREHLFVVSAPRP